MKPILCILAATLLLTGCKDRAAEARIAELEKKLTAMETRMTDLQEKLSTPPAPARPASRYSGFPATSRVESEALDTPARLIGIPSVISISGRVTEQNSVWWKWSYIMVVANTNTFPVRFNANIQFLDRDGFVVDEKKSYDLSLGANLTNRISSFELIDVAPAARVKTLKAIIAPEG